MMPKQENVMIKDKDTNIEDLTSKVFALIVESGKKGILQSDLWKMLNLTSRDGSRIAMKLEKRALITRERVLENGRWTYKLVALKLPIDTKCIESAPCLTCKYEQVCNQDNNITSINCKELEEWVLREYNSNETTRK